MSADLEKKCNDLAQQAIDAKTDEVYDEIQELFYGGFQELMEKVGLPDLGLSVTRTLQVATRYSTELQRDRAEHGVHKLSDARKAALLCMELMRASPVIAPYREYIDEGLRGLRASINLQFSVYAASIWMEIDDIESTMSDTTRRLLKDALQFRSGCRHTLAIAFQMMQDASLAIEATD